MAFTVEHVVSGKQEQVTDEQWKQMTKLFPRMFKIVRQPVIENLSDEAKKIIADADPTIDNLSEEANIADTD